MDTMKQMQFIEKILNILRDRSERINDNHLFYVKYQKITLKIYYNLEKDKFYKTLEIEEVEDKFKVKIFPDNIEKVTDMKGLEDILLILDKQINSKDYTQEQIEKIKNKYKKGQKVELIKMYDLQAIPKGTKGIIDNIDDKGTLHIKWETGSTLGLIVGTDEFKIIG